MGGHPEDGTLVKYKNPLRKRDLSSEPPSPTRLRIPTNPAPLPPLSLQSFIMFPSEIPQFNIDELTGLSNNNYCGGSFGFDEFNHLDPSNVAGPSNIYAGSDVLGNFNNYPDYPTAPTPLDVTHGLYPYEGKSCHAS